MEPKEIKAILITHTHVDHIQGLKVFLKKYKPLVYVTEDLLGLLKEYDFDANYVIYDGKSEVIDDLKIDLINTSHDAKGSLGFIISDD